MASNKSSQSQSTTNKQRDKFAHLIGQKFNGRYEIQSFLGKGAFGKVFKVKDLEDVYEPIKALKTLNDELEVDVLNEVEILEKVNSNYLVKYFGNFEDGMNFYMVFEYCKHGDLDKVIETHKNEGKKIDVEKIKNWTVDILDGLDFLHTKLRVVHFDLKPANIFIAELERCKIGDLGLARNHESLSKVSQIRGTLCYMSPELVMINKTSKIDFKTDIWSFGCILYEMATLEMAFYDSNLFILQQKIQQANVKMPANIDDTLGQMIKMCLVKEKQRTVSCSYLANKIRTHSSDFENSLEIKLKNLRLNNELNKENANLRLNIGNDYYNLGDYNNALRFHHESLQMYRKLYTRDHPSIATSLNNVGVAYDELGDYENALKFYDESLKMRRKLFTGDHPSIAKSLNNVGVAYDELGDYKNALRFYDESLKMRRKLYTRDHPDIAQSLNNVGSAYRGLGDYSNALRFYDESLKIKRKIFTGDHPSIATSLNNVGSAYYGMGDYSNALRFYNESLKMRRKLFTGDHPDIATSLNNVGFSYSRLGDYNNALRFYNESLEISRKLLPDNHPLILNAIDNINIVKNKI